LAVESASSSSAASWSEISVPPCPPINAKFQARGKELYAKACAACHGDDGQGEGPVATRMVFNSHPANFTKPLASIKIRSTQPGSLPQDEDLFRTITRGLPGTAMLSFRNLPADDRWALVHRVKEFFEASGKKFAAPAPLEIPPKLPNSPELMEIGRKEFTRWCQNCHGPEGIGETSVAFDKQRTYPAIRFAFGGGRFLQRGSKEDDLVRTLLAGSSATSPMMSFKSTFFEEQKFEVGQQKLWGVVYYTRKLIEDKK
jgi:cytochrome c oxidase cbb3-type subunit I/II